MGCDYQYSDAETRASIEYGKMCRNAREFGLRPGQGSSWGCTNCGGMVVFESRYIEAHMKCCPGKE